MENTQPLFSVVIPVYKVEKYLEDCINSVISQTFADYEIILVDDGSPDYCPQICDDFATKYPERIIVIHKKNGGLSDARNTGIKNAKGRYLLFIDSDDYWVNETLLADLAIAILEYNYPDLVLFQGFKLFENSGKIVDDIPYNINKINNYSKDEIVKYLIISQSYSMSACTKAIRKNFLTSTGSYFEVGLLGEDLDWFFHIIFHANTIYAIDKHCYMYRIRSGSITTSVSIKNEKDQLKIIKKWKKAIENSKIDEQYKKYYYAILAYAYMVALLNYGKISKKDRATIYDELMQEKSILSFAKNKKSQLTYISVRLFGIKLTSILLKCYYDFASRQINACFLRHIHAKL